MYIRRAEVSWEYLEDYPTGFHLAGTLGLRVVLRVGRLVLSDGLTYTHFDWSKDHEYCEQVGKARLNGFLVEVRISDLYRTAKVGGWPQREGRNGVIPKVVPGKRLLLCM